jgi:endonuclease III
MKDLSVEEQTRIVQKWHSMVVDSTAPLEVRRYQVLLAARLHARCQEPTVRKAMKSMKDAMPALTVDEVAKCDPEVLANLISNLQFYNVKARQVVQAACEIKSRFRGEVPEDQFSLTQITGIGKCFADLLAFVNTRERHTTSMNSQLVDDSFGDSNNCP